MRRLLFLLPVLLAGCGSGHPQPPTTAQSNQPRLLQAITSSEPRDPAPATDLLVFLDVYQISVPFGKVSSNEEFWKRVNEQCLDVGAYDMLYRNGVRVGLAPSSEWEFFRDIINQDPSMVRKSSFQGNQAQSVELEESKELPGEDIFYYDGNNQLEGRTFDRCRNVMALTFRPAPRRLGEIRVKLCPVVRTLRQRLEYSLNNEERELQFVYPERLYDLRLEADIPLESFLIVSPSPEARNRTSVGQTFFTSENPTEREEHVLLLVPHPAHPTDNKSAPVARKEEGK